VAFVREDPAVTLTFEDDREVVAIFKHERCEHPETIKALGG
jgi:hypothetical protein